MAAKKKILDTMRPPSAEALRLAAQCGADPRTCERAVREGASIIRIRSVRFAVEQAAKDLGIVLGGAA